MPGVKAVTDVTGFALLGHLLEMCEGSGVQAELVFNAIPVLEPVPGYIAQGCVPGGTGRNFASYGHKVASLNDFQKALLCDPQTSGGLLIAVAPDSAVALETVLRDAGIEPHCIGRLHARTDGPWVHLR
jgi:selenide,water dikinase